MRVDAGFAHTYSAISEGSIHAIYTNRAAPLGEQSAVPLWRHDAEARTPSIGGRNSFRAASDVRGADKGAHSP